MRLLYIDIDTLRPDHLGCYGYHRATSPNIDALARESMVFENVHAHSAFHWYAGLDEAYDVGRYGMEIADDVHAIASDWLARRGRENGWYLHLQVWDPHTPYRAPARWGEPFGDAPLPRWLTDDVRDAHWRGCGPHSAQEANGYAPKGEIAAQFPRQPQQIPDMASVRRMFDDYDTGVRVADDFVGRILKQLADLGVLDDTAVMISSDHGETLGELNVYGDHQTADQFTTRVPLILRWPGLAEGTRLRAFHYQIDVTATLLELLGRRVPSRWDGVSFAPQLRAGVDAGRDCLVVSQAAWACQRGVRFEDWMYIATRHDAYHLYPHEMLFDLSSDPHQQRDLCTSRPDALARGRALLATWLEAQLAENARDPHDNVMREGGPFHVRGQLPGYATRLRATGRAALADVLKRRTSPHAG